MYVDTKDEIPTTTITTARFTWLDSVTFSSVSYMTTIATARFTWLDFVIFSRVSHTTTITSVRFVGLL